MAKSPRRPAWRGARRKAGEQPTVTAAPQESPAAETGDEGGARYLFLLREGGVDEAVRLIKDRTGIKLVSTADNPEGPFTLDQPGAPGLLLDQLGVAIATLVPDQVVPFDQPDR